jgi:hypothetical protein
MAFYDEIAADVSAILAESGLLTSLRRVTPGTYDPTTGTSAPTTASAVITAVMLDYPIRYIDGTKILHGDKQALIAPGNAPQVNDEILWLNEWWRVVSVETTAPAGVPVLYTVQVRK